MKQKITQSGAIHFALPLIAVLVVVIIGVGTLVASHADPSTFQRFISSSEKTKPKFVGVNIDKIDDGTPNLYVSANMRSAKGADLNKAQCGGGLEITVRQGSTLVIDRSIQPFNDFTDCSFVAENPASNA